MPFRKLNVLIEEKQTLDSLLVSGHPRKLLSVVLLRGWVVTSCSWTKYEVAYECHVCYSRCIHFCKELLLGSTLDSSIMSTDFFFLSLLGVLQKLILHIRFQVKVWSPANNFCPLRGQEEIQPL